MRGFKPVRSGKVGRVPGPGRKFCKKESLFSCVSGDFGCLFRLKSWALGIYVPYRDDGSVGYGDGYFYDDYDDDSDDNDDYDDDNDDNYDYDSDNDYDDSNDDDYDDDNGDDNYDDDNDDYDDGNDDDCDDGSGDSVVVVVIFSIATITF